MDKRSLTMEDQAIYRKLYCGQCCSIQRQFGYFSRINVSFDATFFGLLVSAQLMEDPKDANSWCAIAPKKQPIFSHTDLPQIVSACFSVILAHIREIDRKLDGESSKTQWLQPKLQIHARRAISILSKMGFHENHFLKLEADQRAAEEKTGRSLDNYAEPSGYFLSKAFYFTACAAHQEHNAGLLSEIGYELGKLIYVVDASLDIRKDWERGNFNAFIAAYGLDQSRLDVLCKKEILQRLSAYEKILKKNFELIEFYRHQAIIQNILCVGLKEEILKQTRTELSRIPHNKNSEIALIQKTLLAFILCVSATESNAADFYWGDVVRHPHDYPYKAYGYVCCDSPRNVCPNNCPIWNWADCILNPLHIRIYGNEWSVDRVCPCIVQSPKALCQVGVIGQIGYVLFHGINNLKGITGSSSQKKTSGSQRVYNSSVAGSSSVGSNAFDPKNYISQIEKSKTNLVEIEESIKRAVSNCFGDAIDYQVLYTLTVEQASHVSTGEVLLDLINDKISEAENELALVQSHCNRYRNVMSLLSEAETACALSGNIGLDQELGRIAESLVDVILDKVIAAKEWELAEKYWTDIEEWIIDLKTRAINYKARGDEFRSHNDNEVDVLVKSYYDLFSSMDEAAANKTRRRLLSIFHPDRGGESQSTKAVNKAWEKIKEERGWN